MRRFWFAGGLAAAVLPSLHARALAYDPNAAPARQEAKLLADVSSDSAMAGSAVALQGDTALVGAYQTLIGDQDLAGAVFVHVRSGDAWTLQARLTADPVVANENFGKVLALDDDVAAFSVSIPLNDPAYAPSVRMFARTGAQWTQTAEVQPPGIAYDSGFGRSIALAGDTLLVGDPVDSERAPGAGAVYVFTRAGDVWDLEGKLFAGDASEDQYFGAELALVDDTLLVGASYDHEAGEDAGAVYVFGRAGGTWSEEEKLLPADTGPFQRFGHELALADDLAVIGTCVSTDAFGDVIETAAEVFVRTDDGWVRQATLAPASPPTLKNYCNSVAITDGVIVVGMPEIDDPAKNSGGAYLFSWDGSAWALRATVLVEDDTRLAGSAVAASGDTILLGAPADDELFHAAGAAYVFRVNVPPSQPIEPASGGGCGCRTGAAPGATGLSLLLGLACLPRRRRGVP